MKEETVEIIEIWQPTDGTGEAWSTEKGNMKRIAMLVNGHPYFLEKDFLVEKRSLSKVEAEERGLYSQPN